MTSYVRIAYVLLATSFLAPSLPAIQIDILPGANLSSNDPALKAFQRAASSWSGWIADPITVTINANLTDLGSSNILGGGVPHPVTGQLFLDP